MVNEDQLNSEIGDRIRSFRKGRNLSQRQLAKSAGVTNATISLIESGKTNPSVGSLKRVLDGLEISFAEFFEGAQEEPDDQVFFEAGELIEIGRGDVSFRQVGAEIQGLELQILHEFYKPNASTGRIPLSHNGTEGGVIISGRLEVSVDGKRKILGPGDAYLFSSSKPHKFKAVGPDGCVVVSACTPPSF